MGKVIAGTTMSLDGFMHDPDGSVEPLYADFAELRDALTFEETIRTTGAVVMGRTTFAMGNPDEYAGNYEFQVPIFVLTHTPPQQHPKESGTLTITFVTQGIEQAIAQAKTAAGDLDVQVVGGASTIRQCLEAGLCDELHIDIMPVLLGNGMRLFENMSSSRFRLEKIRAEETTSARVGMVFRVIPTDRQQ